jgi:monoterpene epsilon-lactone hydrolase
MAKIRGKIVLATLVGFTCIHVPVPCAAADKENEVTIDADGTTHLPRITIPFSDLASPEAKKAYVELKDQPFPPATTSIPEMRRWLDAHVFGPVLERYKALYPVNIESKMIGGVRTDIVTPKQGVSSQNQNRVLINLHGGGSTFGGGGPGGQAESIPVAGLGGYRVVSVDYRMNPEYKFPAESEDVAAVYRELLKQYKPENIGIYGCSAGGTLTAQAVAWFQTHDLPRPGAIGIMCASAGALGRGDAETIWPTDPLAPRGVTPGYVSAFSGYLAGTDPKDPLVAPVFSPDVLKKFPPTLLITGSRSAEASGAYYSDIQLTKAGVDSELHVWDGLWHGAYMNPALPENKEVGQIIVNFFNKHLGSK